MLNIFEKFFNSLSKKKKISLFLILFLIILGITFPLGNVKAWLGIDSFAIGAINSLALMFLTVPAAIATSFMAVAGALLGFIMSPNFISLSYTGGDNPVVAVGWSLTRNLANIGILIALVIIGLATVLDIASYGAKKTLPILILVALLINFSPILILVALLINFSPVICGVIIDASNILINYFLEDLTGWDTFGSSLHSLWNTYENSVKNLFDDYKPVGGLLALIFVGLIGGFVLLIYCLIFIVRYVALWILVILAPLAFFAYILPATRKAFNMWWNNFLQWNFIAIVAAFFLYLGHHILALIRNKEFNVIGTQAKEGWGILNDILPYGINIALLLIGLIAGFASSAFGADFITETLAGRKGRAMMSIRKRTGDYLRKMGEGRVAQKGIKGLRRLGTIRTPKPGWGVGVRYHKDA